MGPTIFELKADAHDLLNDLVRRGMDRNQAYRMLRERLDVPEGFEHMARMSTISQVEKAIKVLRLMKQEQGNRLKTRKPVKPQQPKAPKFKAQILPNAEQKRLIREMQERQIRKARLLAITPKFIRPLVHALTRN